VKLTLKRLMFWVVMAAIISYMARGPMPESKLQNYTVAATVSVVIFLAARRHPLGFLILGLFLLNCIPFLDRDNDENAYGVSFWGAYGACFIGALAGWDEKFSRGDADEPGESAE